MGPSSFTLHILSDLHNEFKDHRPDPAWEKADFIILAGDIDKGRYGIDWARMAYPNKEIIYVSGNHEFYDRRRQDVLAELRIAARENGVHFLDDEVAEFPGIRFIGSTLWTDFKIFGDHAQKGVMKECMRSINDFNIIYEGDRIFSPVDAEQLFQKSVTFIKSELAKPFDGVSVVVTHHLPSPKSVADRYKDDLSSAAFASNVEFLMGEVPLWIHGHTHDSMDYMVGNSRVICNPRGYSRFTMPVENHEFEPNLLLKVSKDKVERISSSD